MNRLVPLISTFKQKYPKIRLDVTLTERPVDLVADGYDLGVVVPFMLISDTVVTRLLERMPLAIVAAPEYLKKYPSPQHPSQLTDHTFFVATSPSVRKPVLTFCLGEEGDVIVPLSYDIASQTMLCSIEKWFWRGLA